MGTTRLKKQNSRLFRINGLGGNCSHVIDSIQMLYVSMSARTDLEGKIGGFRGQSCHIFHTCQYTTLSYLSYFQYTFLSYKPYKSYRSGDHGGSGEAPTRAVFPVMGIVKEQALPHGGCEVGTPIPSPVPCVSRWWAEVTREIGGAGKL